MIHKDALDVSLHDSDLHDEVVLTTQLMIAATDSAEQMSQQEVDNLLGL